MRPTQERYQAILRLVAARDRASIAELSRQLKVSEMTIRRDLATLDAEGALRRVRGGAVPAASGRIWGFRSGTGALICRLQR